MILLQLLNFKIVLNSPQECCLVLPSICMKKSRRLWLHQCDILCHKRVWSCRCLNLSKTHVLFCYWNDGACVRVSYSTVSDVRVANANISLTCLFTNTTIKQKIKTWIKKKSYICVNFQRDELSGWNQRFAWICFRPDYQTKRTWPGWKRARCVRCCSFFLVFCSYGRHARDCLGSVQEECAFVCDTEGHERFPVLASESRNLSRPS